MNSPQTSSQNSSQNSSQPKITPQDVVAFFADEDARVQDEVDRILALLMEREPASCCPRHIRDSCFELTIERDCDLLFMKKVAQAFLDLDAGWWATINSADFGRRVFCLSHLDFRLLPPRRGLTQAMPD